jgi:sugar phosphate isomerase/epimerase
VPKVPIALQLYSVRKECEKDLPAVLDAVAEMGYDGVEFAGYYGRTAEQLQSLLSERGLEAVGTHIGVQTLLAGELEKTVEFNKTLGNRYLIVPGLPREYTESLDAWKRTAALFNQLAEKVADEDMQVGYHNHTEEFRKVADECAWDVFARNTRSDVVLQLDTGNALHGGADVAALLKAYPGRSTTVHLKEHSATNDKALIGEGDIPWKEVFRLCETLGGTEWYIVEQETYAYPPLVTVQKCLQNLRDMGK